LDAIQHTEISPGIFEMSGVVSRKKQLLPFLTQHLARVASQLATS